jgi:hypothetical protein
MPTGRSPRDGYCLIGSAGAAAGELQADRTQLCSSTGYTFPRPQEHETLVVREIPSEGARCGPSVLATSVLQWSPDSTSLW